MKDHRQVVMLRFSVFFFFSLVMLVSSRCLKTHPRWDTDQGIGLFLLKLEVVLHELPKKLSHTVYCVSCDSENEKHVTENEKLICKSRIIGTHKKSIDVWNSSQRLFEMAYTGCLHLNLSVMLRQDSEQHQSNAQHAPQNSRKQLAMHERLFLVIVA